MKYLIFVLLNIFLLSSCKNTRITPRYEKTILGTYTSPDQTNSITIRRTNSSSTVLKNETQYIDMEINIEGRSNSIENIYEEINYYGEHNYSFEKYFSSIGWRDQRLFILELGSNSEGVTRTVVIKNQATEIVDNIIIFADDIYLVTNILPNSSVKIPIRWSGKGARRCSLYASVYFANGKIIPRNYSSVQFSYTPKSEAELVNGDVEKNTNCVDGEVTVQNTKIDYRVIAANITRQK
jgi:hypothetical protein